MSSLGDMILFDGDGVFAHKRCPRLQVVHVGLVLELTFPSSRVAQAIPRLYADEGSLLLIGTPEGDDGALVVYCHSGRAVSVEQACLMRLTVVYLHAVVGKELVVEWDKAILDLVELNLRHLVRAVDIALE